MKKNGRIVDVRGTESWYMDDKLHREGEPAVIWPDGHLEWYIHGERHREGGPAVTDSNGYKLWFKNGVRHREDGPALRFGNGHKEWWLDGKLFLTKEAWWEALTPEMKVKALFNGEGV